jgi:hypothetical protein
MTMYPLHYEEAAHILRVLTDCGLPLTPYFSIPYLLYWIAKELEWMPVDRSHAEAGERLVDSLSAGTVDPRCRPRLVAIAGTLVGNFLTTRVHQVGSGEKLGGLGAAPRKPSAAEKPKVRDWARWG